MAEHAEGGTMQQPSDLILPHDGNTLERLPLEMRYRIYDSVLDDLTAQPAHPCGEPSESKRFQGFFSLLRSDQGMQREVMDFFVKYKYCDQVIIYADDTCCLYDAVRELKDSPLFPHLRFKLRARHGGLYDLPGGESLAPENTRLIYAQPGFESAIWNTQKLQPENRPELRPENRMGEHDFCSPEESVTYNVSPFLFGSSMQYQEYTRGDRHDDCAEPSQKKQEGHYIIELSGKLKDLVFYDGYRIEEQRAKLLRWLRVCRMIAGGLDEVAERYESHYPVTQKEYSEMQSGKRRYSFQDRDLEDIEARGFGMREPSYFPRWTEEYDDRPAEYDDPSNLKRMKRTPSGNGLVVP